MKLGLPLTLLLLLSQARSSEIIRDESTSKQRVEENKNILKHADVMAVDVDENSTWLDYCEYLRSNLVEGRSRFLLVNGIRAIGLDFIKNMDDISHFNTGRNMHGENSDPYDPPERGIRYRFKDGKDQYQFNGKNIDLAEYVKKFGKESLVVLVEFPPETKLSVVFDKLFRMMSYPQIKSFSYLSPKQ